MKLIHIVRGDFNPNSLNGVYKVIDSVSKVLASNNLNVCVLSVSNNKEDIYRPQEYKHIRVSESRYLFFITQEFKEFINKQSIDTIYHFHSVFIPWFLPAIKYIKSKGCKHIVLTPHGQYVNEAMKNSLKKRIFFSFFDSKVIQNADIIHLIGKTELNNYIKNNNKNIKFIPNGCNIGNGKLQERDLIFSYLGRLEIKQKGLDLLVKAFSNYKKNGGIGVLYIAGNGPDKKVIEDLIKDENVEKDVVFKGAVYDDKKWDFLRKSAFFLHPSLWDVVPTACMEAASCSVPLIITEETNLGEYVLKYQSGYIIDNDVKDLSKKLFLAEKLFDKSEDYKRMCRNSYNMIHNELNWNNIGNRFINELYSF